MNILTLNNISDAGLKHLKGYQIADDMRDPDGIILRSYNMHDYELPSTVKAIARAGAGVNNIPIEKYSEQGVVVFNTPGANANAVTELVVAGLLLSSRRISQGIEWVNSLKGHDNVAKEIEAGKSQFAGPEIMGKKIGVVGLGAIGVKVANISKVLGMKVYGYDPYMSIDAAWHLSRWVNRAISLPELVSNCDYISIHVPLTDETKGTFNEELFAQMKPGIRLLNFSRGGLVDTPALIKALEDGTVSCYVTDFPDEELIGRDNVIAIPHLGASTPESEENCAEMAALEIKAFLETGNIKNSVNYPSIESPMTEGTTRVTICHANKPKVVSRITNVFGANHINIDNMANKSKHANAYTIVEVDSPVGETILHQLQEIEGIYSVRVIG